MAGRRQCDLEFLLISDKGSDEADTSYSAAIPGSWLSSKRREVGLTQMEIAQSIDERPEMIGAIDRGDAHHGPSFAAYLKYADFLGVTLLEIFTTPVPQTAQEALQGEQGPKEPSKEDLMVSQVLEAIETLKAQGGKVSQNAIRKFIGASNGGMQHYPRVRELLKKVVADRQREARAQAAKYERELVKRVERVIVQLRAEGKRISQKLVSRATGVNIGSLNYYPAVRRVLRAATEGEGGGSE